MEDYDKDYFENGIETGKSCYENYRWLPELTLPFMFKIFQWADIPINKKHRFLDYGCAKGFLVKALKLMGQNSYGYDISEYAINNAHPDVRNLVTNSKTILFDYFDYVISKDVFEHMTDDQIREALRVLSFSAKWLIVLVPFCTYGYERKFVNAKYEEDPTHINRKQKEEWQSLITANGWVFEREFDDYDGYFKPNQFGNVIQLYFSENV